MNEKMNKFERLAERRVTEAIKTLRLIGNLSNRRNYDYTDDHAKQIIDALEGEIKALKGRFREEAGAEQTVFRFRNDRGAQ